MRHYLYSDDMKHHIYSIFPETELPPRLSCQSFYKKDCDGDIKVNLWSAILDSEMYISYQSCLNHAYTLDTQCPYDYNLKLPTLSPLTIVDLEIAFHLLGTTSSSG